MVSWFKNKLFTFFANKEAQLQQQIEFGESVLRSPYYPDDVKAGVITILHSKKNRLTQTTSLKNYMS